MLHYIGTDNGSDPRRRRVNFIGPVVLDGWMGWMAARYYYSIPIEPTQLRGLEERWLAVATQ